VAGHARDASTDDITVEPPMYELHVFVSTLALVTAELVAVRANRLFAQKAVCAQPHSGDAWFHSEL
jgi:hypothetical protein